MSLENVELVRRAYELFNEGGPDAVIGAGIWSPEIVFDFSPSEIPGLGVYRGHDEVRAFFEEDWFGAFPFEEWEVVRAEWGEGSFGKWFELFAPDYEWGFAGDFPEGGVAPIPPRGAARASACAPG